MTDDAKNSAARHMEQVHGLGLGYMPRKKMEHYLLAQVVGALKRINRP